MVRLRSLVQPNVRITTDRFDSLPPYRCLIPASLLAFLNPLILRYARLMILRRCLLIPCDQAWPFFIKSQQTILLATQFVSAVSRAVDGQEDWQDINNRMQELHSNIEPLIKQTENWLDEMPRSTDSEAVIAYSLKQMSKIKLNRFVPVLLFSLNHRI